jgi:phage-related protein
MKPVIFLGDSLKALRDLPPDDFKPMPSVGPGVEEIRVFDPSGAYRVIYLARLAEAVFVLHVFQKKTQATSLRDVALAKARFAQLMKDRK